LGELGTIRRYSYWSERRVREIAGDNSISLGPRWKVVLRTPSLALLPQAEITRERRDSQHNEAAVKIEREIGQLALEDFVTPPSAAFAKGCGEITFGIYKRWDGDGAVILHTRTISTTGCRVEVILFGSIDNCAGYMRGPEVKAGYWRASSAWAIEKFIEHRGTKPAPIYDDDQSIAVEILRVINMEGMTKGKAFQSYPAAEWLAEVYKDVELDQDRWDFRHGDTDVPEPVDRIVVGAPLWVRSTSRLRAIAALPPWSWPQALGVIEWSKLWRVRMPRTTPAAPNKRLLMFQMYAARPALVSWFNLELISAIPATDKALACSMIAFRSANVVSIFSGGLGGSPESRDSRTSSGMGIYAISALSDSLLSGSLLASLLPGLMGKPTFL
jgi:hypothetical protein